MARLAAVVLAAGRSSRMGELKPLLPLGDGAVIGRAVGAYLEAGVSDVRVVVGWRGAEVAAAVAGLGVATVVNDDWRRGMFSSVGVGLASLGADVEAVFLSPADCALVRAETIGRLARAAQVQPAPVTYPLRRGRRGHPPLIARRALPADLSHEPPDGLRGLLAVHDAAALEVEVDDDGVLLDMDAPSDYRRACDYIAREGVPGAARCLALLGDARVPPPVVAHSRAVACVACALTARLNEHDLHLNARLVEAAGLLHDIARVGASGIARRDHARHGAELLGDLGYRRVAAVTAHHMDLPDETGFQRPLRDAGSQRPPRGAESLSEAESLLGNAEAEALPGEVEIVYLADKLVAGTRGVALQERRAARIRELRTRPEGQAHARARLDRALVVARLVERLIGEPVETVARRALAVLDDSLAAAGAAGASGDAAGGLA